MKISIILLEGDAGSGKTQLAKALSADFGLPYTKVTCFADMDKSDVLGAILPVLPEQDGQQSSMEYQYYPSEIVRAYENGWLLEIQEPMVIRDAAVLMALNSALEPDGSINLPTRIRILSLSLPPTEGITDAARCFLEKDCRQRGPCRRLFRDNA